MYYKYYLIPILNSLIKITDNDGSFISLAGYVNKYFPKLAQLEERRVDIIWSGDALSPLDLRQKNIADSIKIEEMELANRINIPLFLLVVLDGNGKVYEIVTKQEVYYDYGLKLSINECSKDTFMNKYNAAYVTGVHNFFNRKNFQLLEFPEQKVLRKNK